MQAFSVGGGFVKIDFDSSLVHFNNLVGTFGDDQVADWIERFLVAIERIAKLVPEDDE